MTSTSGPSSTRPADPSTGDPLDAIDPVDSVVQRLHRDEWGRLVALLVARTRRLDLVEDAVGEAFATALVRWRRDGVPANPTGWIYTAAHRHVVGRLRHEAMAARAAPRLATGAGWTPPDEPIDELPDERLQLILLCCHPALPVDARPALALRLVLGTPTEEIARLFLVSTPTMAARLTRAKKKIAVAGIPLRAPIDQVVRERLDGVCSTIYLAFTAGYAPGSGSELVRADIAGEAVRLADILVGLLPGHDSPRALLALLLLQHARRDARVDDGRLITLGEQDRRRWHRGEIERGIALLDRVPETDGHAEVLRLQALIAAAHTTATTAEATDWPAIADHYRRLETLTGSPVVRLNRAVAVAEVDGPRAGLALLAELDGDRWGNHRLAAVRADLARRAGDLALARLNYRDAIERCANEVERSYLVQRIGELPDAEQFDP